MHVTQTGNIVSCKQLSMEQYTSLKKGHNNFCKRDR
jgi:hypothetical protein